MDDGFFSFLIGCTFGTVLVVWVVLVFWVGPGVSHIEHEVHTLQTMVYHLEKGHKR